MIVSWMTTNRCNLRCKHCYQDAGAEKDVENPVRGGTPFPMYRREMA